MQTHPASNDTSPTNEQPGGPATVGTESREPTRTAPRFGHAWRWSLLIAAVLAVGGYLVFPHVIHGQDHAAAPPGRGARTGPPIVPVVGAVAQAGNVPVYLNGIGTVTSLNTVTVRSRVDGQLVSVMFKEGQVVRQGEVLAQIDPRPFQVQLSQAEGQMARDQAALKNAQTDLQRYQALYAQDAVPQQQLATQMATVTQDEAVIRSDQAQVDNAKLNLTYSRITSPLTGRVGLRLVDPGNMVHATDPNGLVVITQHTPIGVLFTLPEDNLPPILRRLQAGDKLPVEAWDRDLRTKLAAGTLLTVDNEIDPTTGTVRLKAQFPNADDSLFPNQFVNARLLVDTLTNVVTVPAAAIQRNQDSTFVYVVSPDEKVELRTVDVRLTEGDMVAIAGGLSAGETVVIEGVDKLQPGTRVALRLPGENGNGAGPDVRGRHAPGQGAAGQGTPAAGWTGRGSRATPGTPAPRAQRGNR